jgi:hypothetical protein
MSRKSGLKASAQKLVPELLFRSDSYGVGNFRIVV